MIDCRLFLVSGLIPLCCLGTDVGPISHMSDAEVRSVLLGGFLLGLHGETLGIPRYADSLERKGLCSRAKVADTLLSIAKDESMDAYPRENAVLAFVDLSSPEDYSLLEPLFSSTNQVIRTAPDRIILQRLSSAKDQIAYAAMRLSDLSTSPTGASDSRLFFRHFSKTLDQGDLPPPDVAAILSLTRGFVVRSCFVDAVSSADYLLLRHDPAWPTNAARRAMIEKWIGDPGIHEKTKAIWTEALAAFSGPQPAPAAPPGGEFPDVPRDPAVADEPPSPVERNQKP